MKTKDTILLEQAYLKVHTRSLNENTNDIPPDLEAFFFQAEDDHRARLGNVAQAVANGQLTYNSETGIFTDKQHNRYVLGMKDGELDLLDAVRGSGPSNPTPRPPYRNDANTYGPDEDPGYDG